MIETNQHGGIFEIVLANPPVNALGDTLRIELQTAIKTARADKATAAIVIRGAGRMFSAGADITEFDRPIVEPHPATLFDAIEECEKPVVAAVHGIVFGGGCEMALACHYRIAAPSAKFGLPEVSLGLLPGAGGTQRLPRLAGVEAALGMIVSGDPVGADDAVGLGIVDRLASGEDSLAAEAIEFARSLSQPRRTGDWPVTADPAVFDRFVRENARKISNLDAPMACIEAVKAATELPFAEGQRKERDLFMALMDGDQSKALRHVFFAERAAARIEGLPRDVKTRPVTRVGVIGAGTMGGGISMNFLSKGIAVTIVETRQEALDRGVEVIRKNYQASAAKGRIRPEQVDAAMALLTPTLDFGALGECDLVIEAVYEDIAVKKEVFARLDAVARDGAILATNTSFLSVDEIAAVTKRPGDVIGLHFFSPANVMKLVEVVRGARTAPDVLATGMTLAAKIGKVPVVTGVCHGFIGNRMLIQRQDRATELVLEGASPEQIDQVHLDFGMPIGPFQLDDLAGVDIGWHRDPARVETIREALCAMNRWGRKTGAGYYDYDEKGRSASSPVVAGIIEDFRAGTGVEPRAISDEEITVRTLYTMINEGAKILEEGISQRAPDIDVIWIYGYGWPRHKGGPMFWADQTGLGKVVDGLHRYRGTLGDDFTLSPLLKKCARENSRISDFVRPAGFAGAR